MKRTTNPCSPECPDRKPGCHSERCPHGWGDYEKAYQKYLKERHREKIASQEAAAYKEEHLRKALKRKGGRKYAPLR